MKLHSLPKLKGKRRAKKRVGRGPGSGKGFHTTGRGNKGQKARGKVKLGFEGGQLPLIRKLPHQKGFKNPTSKNPTIINVGDLEGKTVKGVITPDDLVKLEMIKKVPSDGVKILGRGEIKTKLNLSSEFLFSENARKKIIEAGGKIEDTV